MSRFTGSSARGLRTWRNDATTRPPSFRRTTTCSSKRSRFDLRDLSRFSP